MARTSAPSLNRGLQAGDTGQADSWVMLKLMSCPAAPPFFNPHQEGIFSIDF